MKAQVIALLMIVMLTVTIAHRRVKDKTPKATDVATKATKNSTNSNSLGPQNIINAPDVSCPEGQRLDHGRECREVLGK